MFSYLEFIFLVEFTAQKKEWNVENEHSNHSAHHGRVLNQFLVKVIEDFFEVDCVGRHRETGSQAAKQVRLEFGCGWRASWLELATTAGPDLGLFIPFLTRQL